jgi:hypothetical protein
VTIAAETAEAGAAVDDVARPLACFNEFAAEVPLTPWRGGGATGSPNSRSANLCPVFTFSLGRWGRALAGCTPGAALHSTCSLTETERISHSEFSNAAVGLRLGGQLKTDMRVS